MNRSNKSKTSAFTLLDAIILAALVISMITIVTASKGRYSDLSTTYRTTSDIRELDRALTIYKGDQGEFPPDDEDNGGKEEGITFKYRNDILLKYLDGDPANGGPRGKFYTFELDRIDKNNKLVYQSVHGQPFWYHSFEDDRPIRTGKVTDPDNPLHPWTTVWKFTEFQIYTKAVLEGHNTEDAYFGGIKSKDNFMWFTNYSFTPSGWERLRAEARKKREQGIRIMDYIVICFVLSLVAVLFFIAKSR